MEWPEEISNDLPARRPDEPPTLRSDILDELHDHLQSSLEHEQIGGSDETSARKSVLSRFGNPSTIACQLWWDAMWGKIMIQRITLGFVALLCAGSIYGLYAIQQTMHASQTLTMGLIEEVRQMGEQSKPSPVDERMKYLEWIPVTVKLQYENGEPVTDQKFEVRMEGINLIGMKGVEMLSESPNSSGIVDFGLIKPGYRRLTTQHPEIGTTNSRQHSFRPGKSVALEIICPRKPLSKIPVKPTLVWPSDLKKAKLWTFLELSQKSFRKIGQPDQHWIFQETTRLLFDPDGSLYQVRGDAIPTTSLPQRGLLAAMDLISGTPLMNLDTLISDLRESQTLPDQTVIDNSDRNILSALLGIHLHPVEFESVEAIDHLDVLSQDCIVDSIWVLRASDESSESNPPLLQVVLPVEFQNSEIENSQKLRPDSWDYQPPELFANLVRKRLAQIDELEAEKVKDSAVESTTITE